jgi:PadR family transcriptional regulator, regulatory protein PadR
MNLPDFGIPNLTKNCNEILILAILFKEKKHGYQLALEIEEKSGASFKFNHGTLYPILHKMEKGGLIKGTWKHEGPKRKRKYYSITAKGKKYAKQQLEEWHNFFKNFFNIIGEIEK